MSYSLFPQKGVWTDIAKTISVIRNRIPKVISIRYQCLTVIDVITTSVGSLNLFGRAYQYSSRGFVVVYYLSVNYVFPVLEVV